MTKHDQALALSRLGFHVFPLKENEKLPMIDAFPERATRDPQQISRWWRDDVMGLPFNYNIGISTTRFGDDEALVVVDVDNKNGKNGSIELLRLDMGGKELPPTFEQSTPTGGRHLVFRTPVALKQGANVLAQGLDIRSKGGFIVAAGSEINGKAYEVDSPLPVDVAPQWLVDACGIAPEHEVGEAAEGVNADAAAARAVEYLKHHAEHSLEGAGGDQRAFAVAARVRDFGVGQMECLELLLDHWNDECQPPWSHEELANKVENAYRYATKTAGANAPEAVFKPLPQAPAPQAEPGQVVASTAYEGLVNSFNKEFAFVVAGGGHHILWETRDSDGNHAVEHLDVRTFQLMNSSRQVKIEGPKGGAEVVPATKLWMEAAARHAPPSPEDAARWRRSFNGLCFRPGLPTPPGFYNVWRGFAVDPLPKDETPTEGHKWALDAFLEHAEKNVCKGDKNLAKWLIGYFAHMVQKPYEKPLVSLVFRGGKGVGKNALIERVAALFGSHATVTQERRYLTGQFNGHMEGSLLLVLDEAIWAGDKQGEGVLKGLITGGTHLIERKGKESYRVANLLRIVLIGNEDWLVPASHDERRYGVFNVGDGRKQQKAYFKRMREEMESGGYRLLLRYLLDYDISNIDVNDAPITQGLLDQKVESLEPVQQWWYGCLNEGAILGGDFSDSWPEAIPTESFMQAIRRYFSSQNIRGRVPAANSISRTLSAIAPSLRHARLGKNAQGKAPYVYRLPDLETARAEWDRHIGHSTKWE